MEGMSTMLQVVPCPLLYQYEPERHDAHVKSKNGYVLLRFVQTSSENTYNYQGDMDDEVPMEGPGYAPSQAQTFVMLANDLSAFFALQP